MVKGTATIYLRNLLLRVVLCEAGSSQSNSLVCVRSALTDISSALITYYGNPHAGHLYFDGFCPQTPHSLILALVLGTTVFNIDIALFNVVCWLKRESERACDTWRSGEVSQAFMMSLVVARGCRKQTTSAGHSDLTITSSYTLSYCRSLHHQATMTVPTTIFRFSRRSIVTAIRATPTVRRPVQVATLHRCIHSSPFVHPVRVNARNIRYIRAAVPYTGRRSLFIQTESTPNADVMFTGSPVLVRR